MDADANNELPAHWFVRQDMQADEVFYRTPRLVAHIDQATINQLTDYYREVIPEQSVVVDLMSSWISHLPDNLSLSRVAGLGMNAEELQRNPQLTDWCIHNLNTNPTLPYPPATFDHALIAVSIQYLTQPIAVLSAVHNALRCGGKICIAMSHRLFPSKAIAAFQQMSATDRIRLVMYYLQHSGFAEVTFIDRSPADADPLWLVVGEKNGQ